MQQTARFEVENLDDKMIDTILSPFKGRHVKIQVQEVKEEPQLSQKEICERVQEARALFKDVRVDPNINLSDLANEVNL
jgi:hypothetical protein